MPQSDNPSHLLPDWTRFEYMSVPVPPREVGAPTAARLPALAVRIRPANAPPGLDERVVRSRGQLDTGATASAVYMWMLWQLGIPIDEGTRQMIYSASGTFWAYRANLGMEILCRRSWLDIGVANVLVPDTPWSRDPGAHRPLLLGLNGFFDKTRMCIDHSREVFWLELPTG